MLHQILLGWRWVAGVQTQGKNYLASEWNINKFTNNRFQDILNLMKMPPQYSVIKLILLIKNIF